MQANEGYRLDPKKPRQLTPDEARQLAETPIDHSDIPPLGDEFFSQGEAGRTEPTPIEARRALVQQTARQVLDLCKAHARDQMDEAQTLAVLNAWLSDFARHTAEIRDRGAGYGPEAIAILRGLEPPIKRSSVEIGGTDADGNEP